MCPLNRFFFFFLGSFKCICQEFPSSLRPRRRVIRWFQVWSRLSRQKRITVKINYAQNKYWQKSCLVFCKKKKKKYFFFFFSAPSHQRLFASDWVQRESFENGAGANCCGGEKECVDVCLWGVSGEEYWNSTACHHHQSLLSQMSEFVFLCPCSSSLPSRSHSCDTTKRQSLSANVNCRWPGDGSGSISGLFWIKF